jgi:hypothetical protein
MSIELNQRVKQLERQLAEVNRLIAEMQARTETPEKRKPGRPRKDEQRTPCQSD